MSKFDVDWFIHFLFLIVNAGFVLIFTQEEMTAVSILRSYCV